MNLICTKTDRDRRRVHDFILGIFWGFRSGPESRSPWFRSLYHHWHPSSITRKWATMPSSSSTRTPTSVRCLRTISTSWCPNCKSSTSSRTGMTIALSRWRWPTSFTDTRLAHNGPGVSSWQLMVFVLHGGRYCRISLNRPSEGTYINRYFGHWAAASMFDLHLGRFEHLEFTRIHHMWKDHERLKRGVASLY